MIVLVNPPASQIWEPQYDTPQFTRLGLASLAAYLVQKNYPKEKVKIVDAKFERLTQQQTMERILSFKPNWVGITAFTNEIYDAGELAREIKIHAPSTRTILGGVHFSALPLESMNEFPQFDFGIMGEGEETLHELLITQNSNEYAKIQGLVFRDSACSIIKNSDRPKIGDQTSLPMPAWDLLPNSPVALLMTSRGCPFHCNFCMNPNGRLVRKREIAQVVEEINYLIKNKDVNHVLFCDEIFTVDKTRTLSLLDQMIALGFGTRYSFSAQTHVNCIDEELLVKIRQAGVTTLGFGIETADPEALKQMGKGTNLVKIRRAVDLAKTAKVGLTTYFILGQPNENFRSALRSIWFAARINPALPIFGVMVPYPGTKVWEYAKGGLFGYKLKSLRWQDFNKQLGNALELETLSRRQLELLQFLGYVFVFLWNLRLVEFIRFCWKFRREGIQLIRKISAPSFEGNSLWLRRVFSR